MHTILLLTAKYLYLVVGLIVGVYWLTLPKKLKIRLVVFSFIAGLVTFILIKIGASLYFDTRPFISQNLTPLYPHAADNGFPSDHTVLTAFIAIVIYTASKRLGIALFIMSLLIGISRVIGHIHNPIDIIGSLVFAFAGGFAAYYLTPKIMTKIKL